MSRVGLSRRCWRPGERVVRVPPHRMGASRRGSASRASRTRSTRWPIARAVVKDGVEQFPVAYLNEQAMEIRLHLRSPSRPRRRAHPDSEPLALASARAVPRARALAEARRAEQSRAYWTASIAGCESCRRARGCGSRASRSHQLRELSRQIDALHRELARARHRAPPAAAGRAGVRGADRRDPDRPHRRQRALSLEASFALQSGTAPIPCSSGQRAQHRLNRGGDRQLNHALHIIAITRAQRDPATKEYLARKEAEGKTTKGALRSLKRHLARHFYQL